MEKLKAKFTRLKKWLMATASIIIVLLASFFAIPILFPREPVGSGAGLYEHYNTGNDAYQAFDSTNWQAQTFTVNETAHNVTSIKLLMLRQDNPGTVTVGIRATSGGHPTGADLTNGTIDGNSFTTDDAGLWYGITLTEYNLNASTKYAIVVRAAASRAKWNCDSSSPTYADGNHEKSINGGSTWTSYTDNDLMFEVWVDPPPDTTPPTYSNVGTNTTGAGRSCRFYTKWADETGLATTGGFIFGTNNTGAWQNETWTAFTTIPDWSNTTKTLNDTIGVRVEWRIWANDTSNNWNNTGLQWLETIDQSQPYPTNISEYPYDAANNATVNINVYWHSQDGRNLSIAILEHNDTGSFVNVSTALDGTDAWANFSFTTQATGWYVVQWRELCNDSVNSFNTTGYYHFTVGYANAPLILRLADLTDRINWAEGIDTVYLGTMFGKTTMTDLQNAIAASGDWKEVLMWSATALKFGFENEDKIKWALNEAQMSQGLPVTGNMLGYGGYSVYYRGLLYGYYWANKYSYLQSKWNLTAAFNNFASAYNWTGHGFMLYVNASFTVSIYLRFYDECAETLGCFLIFHEVCGVSDAITYAETEWKYLNDYFWQTAGYFGYVPAGGYECEGGSFLQIIGWLKYLSPGVGNISRLITDMSNRFINQKWFSHQWTYQGAAYPALVLHHSTSTNERRLKNTITAFGSLFAMYSYFNDTEIQCFQDELNGYDAYLPAWRCLYNETGIYNSTVGQFKYSSYPWNNFPDNTATARATCLQFLLGLTPINATLAVPIEELEYEYQFNMFDSQLFNMSFSTRKVTVGIGKIGAINFTFNATATQMFTATGLYELTFDSNWNTITNCTKIGGLPSRRYLQFEITTLAVGWNNLTAWGEDVGRTLGEVNASLNFNSISWTMLVLEYANGTRYEMPYGYSTNAEIQVQSVSDTFYIYCSEAGVWGHPYP